jgi:hypothetical protein
MQKQSEQVQVQACSTAIFWTATTTMARGASTVMSKCELGHSKECHHKKRVSRLGVLAEHGCTHNQRVRFERDQAQVQVEIDRSLHTITSVTICGLGLYNRPECGCAQEMDVDSNTTHTKCNARARPHALGDWVKWWGRCVKGWALITDEESGLLSK